MSWILFSYVIQERYFCTSHIWPNWKDPACSVPTLLFRRSHFPVLPLILHQSHLSSTLRRSNLFWNVTFPPVTFSCFTLNFTPITLRRSSLFWDVTFASATPSHPVLPLKTIFSFSVRGTTYSFGPDSFPGSKILITSTGSADSKKFLLTVIRIKMRY